MDAFSSQEIIETYDEEDEKQWRLEHKQKMREHKAKEALERQSLMKGKGKDDVMKQVIDRLEELELMEELENELEAVSEENNEVIQSMLKEGVEQTSHKQRISHFNKKIDESKDIDQANEQLSNHDTVSAEKSIEINDNNESLSSNSDSDDDEDDGDEDDDDISAEFKEIERKAALFSSGEKLVLYKAKLDEVQEYLQNFKPRTIEDISHKADKMFLSDHLLSAIETIEDELNCDQYLNGGNNFANEASSNVVATSVPKETKTILKKKKRISFASEDDVKSFDSREEPNKLFTRKISFALEDDVKSYNIEEEPSRITTTILFDHGPVLNLCVNHSEAVFNETNEKSDVIRSPVDIYKEFAACTLNESNMEQGSAVVPKIKSKPKPMPISVEQESCFVAKSKSKLISVS